MSLSFVKHVPAAEQEAIESYIRTFGGVCNGIELVNSSELNLPFIFRFWEKDKNDLFQMFNQKLILEKPCTIAADISHLAKNFYETLKQKPQLENFWDTLWLDFLLEKQNTIFPPQFMLYMTSPRRFLAQPYYSGEEFALNDKVKIRKNMKFIKILKKCNEVFSFCSNELLSEFELAYSRVLNQRTLSGTLCLSIHPLDYLTMSDNECGWSSCMSWTKYGEYRAGTIEMMNSPCVIVAYLKSENETMTLPSSLEWNSKKWRCLYIVSEDIITSVTQYPYTNDELDNKVLSWLRELADASDFREGELRNEVITFPNSETILCMFETDVMYNDMIHKRDARKCLVYNETSEIYLNYSGILNCMRCGHLIACPSDTSLIICDDCYDQQTFVCALCGCTHHLDQRRITSEGDIICCDCQAYECQYCGYSTLHKENICTIYLHRDDGCVTTHKYCKDCLIKSLKDLTAINKLQNSEIHLYQNEVKLSYYTVFDFSLYWNDNLPF